MSKRWMVGVWTVMFVAMGIQACVITQEELEEPACVRETARCRALHPLCEGRRGPQLDGVDLYAANMKGADLRCGSFVLADLYAADLEGANLAGADLRGADLYAARLRGADLRGADLRCTELGYADLEGAQLQGALVKGTAACTR